MKILFVTNNLHSSGGVQQYGKDFLRGLNENHALEQHLEFRSGNLIAKLFFFARFILAVFLKRPDFILVNHINYAPLAVKISQWSKIPFGVIVYGIEAWEIKEEKRRAAIKKAQVIISVSNFTAEKMVSQGYADSNQLFVVVPTLDMEEFFIQAKPEHLLARHKLQDKKVILTVCRLSAKERYKGYDRVIRALPRVLELVPEAVYVLAGEGDDKARVERLTKDLNLSEKVIFIGRPSWKEKTAYYNLADVFVMPSTGEGFGIVFLEALASGVPVIAGNKDASPEPLLNGRLGTLINPEDITAIAKALIEVLQAKVEKNLLDKVWLRQQVVENFGSPSFQERVRKFIDKIEA